MSKWLDKLIYKTEDHETESHEIEDHEIENHKTEDHETENHKTEDRETENHKSKEDFRYALEERTAIIQFDSFNGFDGEESECEYKALLDFVNENRESLKKHIKTIAGEEYLRLKKCS